MVSEVPWHWHPKMSIRQIGVHINHPPVHSGLCHPLSDFPIYSVCWGRRAAFIHGSVDDLRSGLPLFWGGRGLLFTPVWQDGYIGDEVPCGSSYMVISSFPCHTPSCTTIFFVFLFRTERRNPNLAWCGRAQAGAVCLGRL